LKKSKGGKKKQVRFSMDRVKLLAKEGEEEEELSDLSSLSPKPTHELPSLSLSDSPANGTKIGEGQENTIAGQAAVLHEVAANGSGKEGEKTEEREEGERGIAMAIKDGEFAWSGAAGEPVILSGINLEVKEKEFVVIVGPVGCGKSSLLGAMLQEMHKVFFKIIKNIFVKCSKSGISTIFKFMREINYLLRSVSVIAKNQFYNCRKSISKNLNTF
jgi:ABC-type glutathione transport system ATPase component